MKKIFYLILLQFFVVVMVFANPACPDSVQVLQPDGAMIWTRVHGDEFYNWRSTMDGYVILRDKQQRYCYAIVDGDSLMPSNFVVHNLLERTGEEKAFLASNTKNIQQFISVEQQQALANQRAAMIAQLSDNSYIATQSATAVIGKRKILTILVGFKDKPFTRSAADFDKLMNQESGMVENNYGSVRNFYNEDSYGKLDVSAVVVGPFIAKQQSLYYRYDKTNTAKYVRKLVEEAVEYASQVVDFSTLDGDNDGYVDCIHVIFAGHGLSCGADDGLIWEHQYTIDNTHKFNGKRVSKYIITPELSIDDQLAPVGTICHEFGHILGAPDFYDRIDNIYSATGQYDLMCNGGWNGSTTKTSGHYPAHHNAYTKCYLFGWGTPQIITARTNSYTLSSATKEPVFCRINTSTSGEFFLLENRTKINFDILIPNAGLIVYHIHKELAATIENGDYINSKHPLMCYIVNASATQNPTESPSSYGEQTARRAFPGTNSNKTLLTSNSTPSFTAWNGVGTGVNICFIRKDKNDDISFTVNPQIEGPNQLCKEKTYSVTGVVPDKDTVVWSYKTDIKPLPYTSVIKFPNGNKGASVTVKRGAKHIMLLDSIPKMASNNATQPVVQSGEFVSPLDMAIDVPYVGTVTLYAMVHSGNGTYTIEKKIELPENIQPKASMLSRPLWHTNDVKVFTEVACTDIEDENIKWYVQYPQDTATIKCIGRTIALQPTKTGKLTMRVVNDCGCPTKNDTTYTFSVITGAVKPPLSMKSYQNPVNTSSMSIVIERNKGEETDVATFAVQEPLPNYTIELWSELQGRVRTLTANAKSVSLDVAGLPNGWYQLLLLQDGQLLDSGNVLLTH